MTILLALDIFALMTAIVAAWLWFRASRNRLRRITRDEEIDAADLNRMIVSINRSQMLNARAAAASAISALAVAVRIAYGVTLG